jgi:hypothetical protein
VGTSFETIESFGVIVVLAALSIRRFLYPFAPFDQLLLIPDRWNAIAEIELRSLYVGKSSPTQLAG